jgi:hypothetical protein
MANPEPLLDRPQHLDRVPRTPEELIAMGAEIISEYLDPENLASQNDPTDRFWPRTDAREFRAFSPSPLRPSCPLRSGD